MSFLLRENDHSTDLIVTNGDPALVVTKLIPSVLVQ
jgi:hypothetical protein